MSKVAQLQFKLGKTIPPKVLANLSDKMTTKRDKVLSQLSQAQKTLFTIMRGTKKAKLDLSEEKIAKAITEAEDTWKQLFAAIQRG